MTTSISNLGSELNGLLQERKATKSDFKVKATIVGNTLVLHDMYRTQFKRVASSTLMSDSYNASWMMGFKPNIWPFYCLAAKYKLDVLVIPKYRGHFPFSRYFNDRHFTSIAAAYFQDSNLPELPDELKAAIANLGWSGMPNVGWYRKHSVSRPLF